MRLSDEAYSRRLIPENDLEKSILLSLLLHRIGRAKCGESGILLAPKLEEISVIINIGADFDDDGYMRIELDLTDHSTPIPVNWDSRMRKDLRACIREPHSRGSLGWAEIEGIGQISPFGLFLSADAGRKFFEESPEYSMENMKNTDIGYVCGQLFATLQHISARVNGGAMKYDDLYDNQYPKISASPRLFPRLLQYAQRDLARLRTTEPEFAAIISERISNLIATIKQFPTHLKAKEQGRFVIGFHCQMKADYIAAGW